MGAQERAIPFWPDEVPAAIHAQVDGNAALETVQELSRFHRVHGSPGFAAAAELIKKKLFAAGLSDAVVEHFPSDGKTAYAHFRSYYGWNPVSASLEEVSAAEAHRVVPEPAGRARQLQPGRRRHDGARGRRARRAGEGL